MSERALKTYVYFITPTRAGFIDDPRPEESAAVQAHFDYLKGMLEAGTLILAGPALEAPHRGVVIYEAADDDAARAVVDGDEAVKAGVFTAEWSPFKLSLHRNR